MPLPRNSLAKNNKLKTSKHYKHLLDNSNLVPSGSNALPEEKEKIFTTDEDVLELDIENTIKKGKEKWGETYKTIIQALSNNVDKWLSPTFDDSTDCAVNEDLNDFDSSPSKLENIEMVVNSESEVFEQPTVKVDTFKDYMDRKELLEKMKKSWADDADKAENLFRFTVENFRIHKYRYLAFKSGKTFDEHKVRRSKDIPDISEEFRVSFRNKHTVAYNRMNVAFKNITTGNEIFEGIFDKKAFERYLRMGYVIDMCVTYTTNKGQTTKETWAFKQSLYHRYLQEMMYPKGTKNLIKKLDEAQYDQYISILKSNAEIAIIHEKSKKINEKYEKIIHLKRIERIRGIENELREMGYDDDYIEFEIKNMTEYVTKLATQNQIDEQNKAQTLPVSDIHNIFDTDKSQIDMDMVKQHTESNTESSSSSDKSSSSSDKSEPDININSIREEISKLLGTYIEDETTEDESEITEFDI